MEDETKEIKDKKIILELTNQVFDLNRFFEKQHLCIAKQLNCIGFYLCNLQASGYIDDEDLRHLFYIVKKTVPLLQEAETSDKPPK